jgi:hypothetical protein
MNSMLNQMNANTIACRTAADKQERVFNRIGQRVASANAVVNWAVNQLTVVKKAKRGVAWAVAQMGSKSVSVEEAEAEIVAAKETMRVEEEAWNEALERHEELWKVYLVAFKAEEDAKKAVEEEDLDEVYAEARESARYWDSAY